MSATDLRTVEADLIFDGGDLDCGSGLALLIREKIMQVPIGGVLEICSRERTVKDDLPPWCQLTGHTFLGDIEGDGCQRYFVRRGEVATEDEALEEDRQRAQEYRWRLRVRATGPMRSTAYCRNLSFCVGQPASFEERDEHPSAVEYLLGALAGDLAAGFQNACAQARLEVDEVELTVNGRLRDPLATIGIGEQDPSVAEIALKCFATTFDDETKVRAAWEQALSRSPLATTLARAVALDIKLAIV